MHIFVSWLDILRKVGQKTGPYLILEILLPGGTLLALLLFLYRRRSPDFGRDAQRAIQVALRALAVAFESVFWCHYPQRSTNRSDR